MKLSIAHFLFKVYNDDVPKGTYPIRVAYSELYLGYIRYKYAHSISFFLGRVF